MELLFEAGPDVLNRVEIRRVRRPLNLMLFKPSLDGPVSIDWSIVLHEYPILVGKIQGGNCRENADISVQTPPLLESGSPTRWTHGLFSAPAKHAHTI